MPLELPRSRFAMIPPMNLDPAPRPRVPGLAFPILLLPLLALLAGCAAEQPSVTLQKVSAGDRAYTSDDFAAIGFKVSKQYDVTDLPGATSATYGFWRPPDGNPVDYQVRIYASHQEAVQLGVAHADEATGEDAVLDVDKATWRADVPERRTVFRIVGAGDTGGLRARYPDYFIRSNVIILCGGANPEDAQSHCRAILAALDGVGVPG